jgi:galactokinase
MSSDDQHLFSSGQITRALEANGLPGTSAERYLDLVAQRVTDIGLGADDAIFLASAPGRTELCGNHTDHNLGKVVAASIDLDTIALIRARSDRTVRVISEGFPTVEVSADDLDPNEAEEGTTAALVRGVLAECVARGYRIGGFDAVASSRVLAGSGLSSSASFEVLIGAIVSTLFNDGAIGATENAQIGQVAENRFFGKPSGLMDQVACATGGAVGIDFRDVDAPDIRRVEASFESAGYSLCVVDTGGDHADLTDEYAAIFEEMREIAGAFGKKHLRGVDPDAVLASLSELRKTHGDRAVNRALHFFAENERVDQLIGALASGQMSRYISLMQESGNSSALYLQNCAPAGTPREQAVLTALALADRCFRELGLVPGTDAAARVHGGGFAGTIQVLLPTDAFDTFAARMNTFLSENAVTRIAIRPVGAIAFPLTKEER